MSIFETLSQLLNDTPELKIEGSPVISRLTSLIEGLNLPGATFSDLISAAPYPKPSEYANLVKTLNGPLRNTKDVYKALWALRCFAFNVCRELPNTQVGVSLPAILKGSLLLPETQLSEDEFV